MSKQYPLSNRAKAEIAAIMTLEEQAIMARNSLYSIVADHAIDDLELDKSKTYNFNFEEIRKHGAKVAKLIEVESESE
jgi:hypothetical protein